MGRISKGIGAVVLAIALTACGAVEAQSLAAAPSQPITQSAEGSTGERLLQLVTEEGETILFALNNSSAADSLYAQLPLLLEIEGYGDNEKIFYPPEKLNINNTPMAEGPAGTLAYYAPWGNVAIYYGDCEGASGLYQLGQVLSGAEHISAISGMIQVEAVESAANLPTVSTPPVQATTMPEQDHKALPASAQNQAQPEPARPVHAAESEEDTMSRMQITVGNKTFAVTLEENEAARSFAQMLQDAPVVLDMSDYSGFEKVGSLGTRLPESNRRIAAQPGDVVLYNGNQIVVFYGSNTWSYTKLGSVDDLSGWEEALGDADATLTFSLD